MVSSLFSRFLLKTPKCHQIVSVINRFSFTPSFLSHSEERLFHGSILISLKILNNKNVRFRVGDWRPSPTVTDTDLSSAESRRPDSLTIPTELISDETLRWLLVTKYTTRDERHCSVQSQVSGFENIFRTALQT